MPELGSAMLSEAHYFTSLATSCLGIIALGDNLTTKRCGIHFIKKVLENFLSLARDTLYAIIAACPSLDLIGCNESSCRGCLILE